MKSFLPLLALVLTATFSPAQSVFPIRDEGEGRSRSYRVLHYRIEVSLDDVHKKVTGKVSSTIVPFFTALTSIEFDAEGMDIRRVMLGGKKELKFEVLPKTLTIALDKPYSFSDTLLLSLEYSCTPQRGLYFVQPDSDYQDKPWQIWTQGEDMDNHFWFPCYDYPNQKSTSEVIATVPKKYTLVSNGRLVNVSDDRKGGTKTFHWKETKPHSSYLIMLAAGEYAVLKDRAGSIPLEFYVYPSHTGDARACFKETAAMVDFFGTKIGFTYPWEKYAQVLLRDFMFGGMENASATTLADEAAVYNARARIDHSPTSLIAHELAHQWWGDVVTCKDWRHIWLNEGFASYFDPLYHEYSLGRDEFDYIMYDAQQAGLRTDRLLGRKPIVSVGSYSENVYPRGASVLHMLRFVLGDQLFWRGLNHYITKFQYTAVETNDLKNAIEETTGQNLFWFFDQWVYKAGHPVFAVSWQYSDTAKAVFLNIRQTQTIDSLTGVFRTPVDVEITSPQAVNVHRLFISSADTTCVLPSQERPELVIFDKGNWLLKELDDEKSEAEWTFQAVHATNPIDRLLAIQFMTRTWHGAAYTRLCETVALKDSFWAVRKEALSSLGTVAAQHDSLQREILTTLVAASHDAKPAVREAALEQLGNLRGKEVVTRLQVALKDSSYGVMAGALGALAKADSAHAATLLESYLNVPSYRNILENTALNLLVSVDSSRALAVAIKNIGYGKALSTRYASLHILGRYGRGRKEIGDLVAKFLDDKNEFFQSAVARTLGEFGDAAYIPALERLAGNKDRRAAESAAASIKKITSKQTETE